MTLYELIKNHQHRERLKEILLVFSEQGLGFLISKIRLQHHLPFTQRLQARIQREKAVPVPVRLRLAFERLGPTFIKFGQLLSLRPDVLPAEYITEFEKMQDQVPVFPLEEAKQIVEQELGKPVEKIFSSFSSLPLASASISQVYTAKLKGKTVAVKVQRPGIKETLNTDIELMYKLAQLLEQHIPELKQYHLKGIIHEFEHWTVKELNFRIEAHYAQQMAKNSRGLKKVKIPEIYPELSTERVLTMEFIDGIPLHDIEKLRKQKINLKAVFRNGYEVFIRHFFIDGLFHADPHPGNILILKDGRIALIDFGIIGQFDQRLKENTLEIFRSIINNDYETAAEVLLSMSLDPGLNREAFAADLKYAFEQLQYTSVQEVQLSPFLHDLMDIINKHHLQIPVEFVLFEKTLMTIEGIALKYQPEFNLVKETKSSLQKLLDHRYAAKHLLQKTKRRVSEYAELAEKFPQTALEIMERAKRFKFNIEIEDKELKDLTSEIERSSGNLALGVIVAGLIVSSALMMQTTIPIYFYVAGFIVAGLLTLWLVHRTIFIEIFKEV